MSVPSAATSPPAQETHPATAETLPFGNALHLAGPEPSCEGSSFPCASKASLSKAFVYENDEQGNSIGSVRFAQLLFFLPVSPFENECFFFLLDDSWQQPTLFKACLSEFAKHIRNNRSCE